MSSLGTIVLSICTAAVCAGVVGMLAPDGAMKKPLQTLLGVFLLCVIVVPLASFVLDFSPPDMDTAPIDTTRVQEEWDALLQAQAERLAEESIAQEDTP